MASHSDAESTDGERDVGEKYLPFLDAYKKVKSLRHVSCCAQKVLV